MKVYLLNINDIKDEDILLVKNIFKTRYENALKFTNRNDFLRNIGAALLLIKYLGIHNENELSITKSGKPYITNNTRFNYSHSGDYVVFAEGENEIGIDIENINENKVLVKDKLFNNKELEYANMNLPDNFFILWTKKESVMKCIGDGLSINPRSIDVLQGEAIVFRKYTLYIKSVKYKDYIISVAQKTNDFDIELIN